MRFQKKLSIFELTVNSYSTKSEITLIYNKMVVKEFQVYGEIKDDDVRLKPTGYDLPLLINFEEELIISPNFREILFVPIPPSAQIVIKQGPVYLNFHVSPEPLKKGYRAHFFPEDDFYYATMVRPDFTVFSEYYYYIPVRLRSQEKKIVALKGLPMETYQLDWFLHKNFVVSEVVECVEKEDGIATYFTGKSFFDDAILVGSGEENAQLLGRKRTIKKEYEIRTWR
ncbi:MAG: hypothetical protein ACPLN0_03880 [Candidatus Hydrothermia bacterium]